MDTNPGTITSKYYFNEYVNNSDGSPVSNAQVSIYDKDNTLEASAATDETGNIATQELMDYWANSTDQIFYAPHTINTSFQGGVLVNTTEVNMSTNRALTITFNLADVPEFGIITLLLAIVIAVVGITMSRKI